MPCLRIVCLSFAAMSLSFTTVFICKISFALDFYIVTLSATVASRVFARARIRGVSAH